MTFPNPSSTHTHPALSLSSPPNQPISLPEILIRDMTDQLESLRFQLLLEPALQAYENFEKKAGVSLTRHPLSIKLQNCDSVEDITGVFQDQAQAFRNLQRYDKIMKSIKMTVSALFKLSSAASLSDAFEQVRQQELVARFTSLTV